MTIPMRDLSPRRRPISVISVMPSAWSPPHKPKPSSRTFSRLALLAVLSLLLVPALIGFAIRLNPFRLSSFQLPRTFPPSLCLAVTATDSTPPWSFNSRALCISSSVCLPNKRPDSAFLHAADRRVSKCTTATPDWTPRWNGTNDLTARFGSCTDFEHETIICAHGEDLEIVKPKCPKQVAPASWDILTEAQWLEHLTIIVPAYPWPENIFHFANVLTSLTAVVHALPTLINAWSPANFKAPGGLTRYFDGHNELKSINVIFRGRKLLVDRNIWQRELLDVTLRHALTSTGLNVTTKWLVPEEEGPEYTCIRNAIVMGRRGDVNALPFANASQVPSHGHSVPWDAVVFKKAMFAAYDIPVRLPNSEKEGIIELPPLTVGYAKRTGELSKTGWNVLPSGIFRRLSPADEEWFQDMLLDETTKAGAGLRIFVTTAEDSLEDQVTNIAKVGFVVGLHGANLVNSMFMSPFGALFEIAPAGSMSPCYMGGLNSGLKYMRHESTEWATAEESGCTAKDRECQEDVRYRMVKLGAKVDRDRVRQLLLEGIQHLRDLHARYPRGIPVIFNKEAASYKIKDR